MQTIKAARWLAVASCLGFAALAAQADSNWGERSAQASLRVTINVPLHESMRVLEQPAALTVTAEDLQRRYVDVQVPVRVAVRSNHPQGYTLMMAQHADFLQDAEVQGPQGEMRFAGSTAMRRFLPGRGLRTEQVELRFRLHLSAAAREGQYPWPVQVSLAHSL